MKKLATSIEKKSTFNKAFTIHKGKDDLSESVMYRTVSGPTTDPWESALGLVGISYAISKARDNDGDVVATGYAGSLIFNPAIKSKALEFILRKNRLNLKIKHPGGHYITEIFHLKMTNIGAGLSTDDFSTEIQVTYSASDIEIKVNTKD